MSTEGIAARPLRISRAAAVARIRVRRDCAPRRSRWRGRSIPSASTPPAAASVLATRTVLRSIPMPVSLDDKYALNQGRAYLCGIDALVWRRLQRWRDQTAGFVPAIAARRWAGSTARSGKRRERSQAVLSVTRQTAPRPRTGHGRPSQDQHKSGRYFARAMGMAVSRVRVSVARVIAPPLSCRASPWLGVHARGCLIRLSVVCDRMTRALRSGWRSRWPRSAPRRWPAKRPPARDTKAQQASWRR